MTYKSKGILKFEVAASFKPIYLKHTAIYCVFSSWCEADFDWKKTGWNNLVVPSTNALTFRAVSSQTYKHSTFLPICEGVFVSLSPH